MIRIVFAAALLLPFAASAFPNQCFKHVTCPHQPPGQGRTTGTHTPPK